MKSIDISRPANLHPDVSFIVEPDVAVPDVKKKPVKYDPFHLNSFEDGVSNPDYDFDEFDDDLEDEDEIGG